MTSFVIVDPHRRAVRTVQCDDIHEAQALAALNGVDHGVLGMNREGSGIGYCVYEYGLFIDPSIQAYFSIHGVLIAGAAVFYGFDEMGETVDLLKSQLPDVRFYLGINDVENAISAGQVARPFMAVNGETIWEWPKQPPEGFMR